MENIDQMYQLERFSKTNEEFEAYYEKNLKEKVEALELERQETINLAKKQATKMILPAVGVLLFFIFLQNLSFYALAAAAIYGYFVFQDIPRKKKELTRRIKQEVVTELVKFLNDNFTYEPNKRLSKNQFIRSNIFKHNPNRYSGDDLISGYVGSDPNVVKELDEDPTRTDLEFSEVKAQRVERYRDKDGKTRERTETIFQGLFFIADFNKDFKGTTLVVPNKKRFKGFSSWFQSEDKNRLEEIELEDLEFTDKFTVKTTDPIEARYILTPSFMNRMVDFTTRKEPEQQEIEQPKSVKEAFQLGLSGANSEDKNFTNTPYFSFRNGNMYFMLPTGKEHFEFNLFLPLDKRLMKSYFVDLNLALELVDELNLNLRIWTKE